MFIYYVWKDKFLGLFYMYVFNIDKSIWGLIWLIIMLFYMNYVMVFNNYKWLDWSLLDMVILCIYCFISNYN